MTKYFITPFADSGDKNPVPEVDPGNGTVNYDKGYGPNYELPYSDPSSLDIDVGQYNQVLNDVTGSLQAIQQVGAPPFITIADNGGVAFPYAEKSVCTYMGKTYTNVKAANLSQDPSASESGWFVNLSSEKYPSVSEILFANTVNTIYSFTTPETGNYEFTGGFYIELTQSRSISDLVFSFSAFQTGFVGMSVTRTGTGAEVLDSYRYPIEDPLTIDIVYVGPGTVTYYLTFSIVGVSFIGEEKKITYEIGNDGLPNDRVDGIHITATKLD